MRRIVWTAEAADELEAIRVYILAFDPAAANRVARRIVTLRTGWRSFPIAADPLEAIRDRSR